MKFSAQFTTILALLALGAFATPLPPCSTTSITPCSCPSGTAYEESVTFAVIGAAAIDVKNLISDFFQPAWLGGLPFATHGSDNQPGSTRTSNLPTAVGIYVLTEKLTKFKSNPNGSFIEKFELLNPVQFTTHNGSFGGYWITLASEAIFQYETAIVWSAYACSTGHPQRYAAFHESALKNATSVLQGQGMIKGTNVAPFSIQAF